MDTNDIKLGRTNKLTVSKTVEFGVYLDGGPVLGEILLPRGEITGETAPSEGEEVEVFVYLDQQERLVATMRKPLAQVGDFAFLRVAWVNNYGAFLAWGLQKDLFVPFSEQKTRMQKGFGYVVHIHTDEQTYRIVGSAKVERYLSDELPPYARGDEVDALLWQRTGLGFKVIVDNRYGGLLYADQVYRQLNVGDTMKAYVQQVRQDGKIDLQLQRVGQEAVWDFSGTLLRHIRTSGGQTRLGDKSSAEEIRALFGVSKKVFKKAVGDLYRRRLIEITPAGLRLTDNTK
ncbi:MAG: S1-like domain-containing RNA-binding protein [Prevotellaceae bacterium]|nr:S1-like domain-containing RNA-binding protein [Prevotellaceae bacterium]